VSHLGLSAFEALPAEHRRLLLVLALAVHEAERQGDRELARSLCGVVLREARRAADFLDRKEQTP
jgi:hypothetical protein